MEVQDQAEDLLAAPFVIGGLIAGETRDWLSTNQLAWRLNAGTVWQVKEVITVNLLTYILTPRLPGQYAGCCSPKPLVECWRGTTVNDHLDTRDNRGAALQRDASCVHRRPGWLAGLLTSALAVCALVAACSNSGGVGSIPAAPTGLASPSPQPPEGGSGATPATGWSAPLSVTQPGLGLDPISCPSASFCMAGGADQTFIYNGSSWSAPQSLGPSGNSVFSFSCASASFCMAVGGEDAFTFDGSSWSPPHVLGPSDLVSVSCPSVSFCAAVGLDRAFTYNGSSWSKPIPIIFNGGLASVSCASATFCMAVGSAHAVTYNGSTWSAPQPVGPEGAPDSVSCPAASFCAVADVHDALIYNGSSWSEPVLIDPSSVPGSISCPSASFCMAVDASGNAITFDGSSWSKPDPVDPNAYDLGFEYVSCPSDTFCMAGEGTDNALIYR